MNSAELGRVYSKLRFLVVDDFDNFRMSMKQMLRSFGSENVEVASNGSEAIYHCTYNPVDVVLCDYNLGGGKDGQHVLEELRFKKILKHVSLFIMVTAETSRDMVMGAREYQPDAYITKPITRATLEKRLNALIERRQVLHELNRELDVENLPRAISLCQEIMTRHPRYRSMLTRALGDLYFRTGDFTHARRIYEEVLKQRELPWAKLGLAKVFHAEGQKDKAVDHLNELIAAHPDYTQAYDQLAVVFHQQGKDKQAQQTLEKAIALSPNAILRHRNLGELASENQDMQAAAEAFRATVHLGKNSVHDSAENYLNLGRSLAELSDADTSEEGRKNASEAIAVLERLGKRFRDDETSQLTALLIESRVHAGQGNDNESHNLLEKARVRIDTDSIDAETGLELARTYYARNQTKDAEALLNKLAQRFESQPEIISRIEALLDEPVSFQKRLQARGLNRDGIKAFEQDRHDEAIDAFEKALEMVPRHPALNLNLVQVLIKQHREPGAANGLLNRCEELLSRVDHIPEQHRQYKRYRFLLDKVAKLQEAAQP